MARMIFNGNQHTAPVWAADYMSREHVVPGGARLDPSQFPGQSAVTVTLTANVAAAATSLPVIALAGAIPAGTLLYFGEVGELARVSANANAGATTIAVDAIGTAFESGDVATFPGAFGAKYVASGTVVGRTFLERETNIPFGPGIETDDELYLVAFDVRDASINADVDLYRYGSLVKENFLPQWATMSNQMKAALRARYQTTKGVA